MQNRKWKVRLTIVLAGMAALNLAVFWSFRDRVWKGYGDFAIFYTAGRILAAGQGHRLYDVDLQFREQQKFVHVEGRRAPLPFNHPPFEALLFVGLAHVSYFAAYCIWTAINVGILLTLPRLARPSIGLLADGSAGVWLPAMLAYFPLGLALLQGQDTVLLLLIVVLAYRAFAKNVEWEAGCWLALGLIRPQIIVPLALVFALQRRWKLLAAFAGTGTVLGLISAAVVGWNAAWHYPAFVGRAENGLVAPASVLRMPNLHGLLITIGAGIGMPSRWMNGLTVIASILLVGAVVRGWRSEERSNLNLGFSMALVMAVLVSYHAYEYDLTLLLLPMALVADYASGGKERRMRSEVALLLPIALLLFAPLHFLLGTLDQRTSLLALILLAWAAAMWWELRWLRVRERVAAAA